MNTYAKKVLVCQCLRLSQMSIVITYDYILLFAFVRTISYHNWFVYIGLYYPQILQSLLTV